MSEETKTVKTSSWATKIWSAIVGAAVGIASMFGITSNEIATQKAKVQSVKTQATAALEALKAGDVTTATANLKAVIATGTEIVADAKALSEKVKEADSKSVVEKVKDVATEKLVKDQVKKVETAQKAYSAK